VLSLERQERFRQRYALTHPGWRPSSHLYRDRVVNSLFPSARVLDLGCGRGGVMEQLHGMTVFTSGLDPHEESLREHRQPALSLVCGLADALPYEDGAFDVVCCSWVLEHLSHPANVFREVVRVLDAGGRFIFLTPNLRHPLLRVNQALRWTEGRLVDRLYGREEADIFPAYYRANTASRVDALARDAGLQRISVHWIGDPTYLAFNELLFRVGSLLETITPLRMRVHLVGEYASR